MATEDEPPDDEARLNHLRQEVQDRQELIEGQAEAIDVYLATEAEHDRVLAETQAVNDALQRRLDEVQESHHRLIERDLERVSFIRQLLAEIGELRQVNHRSAERIEQFKLQLSAGGARGGDRVEKGQPVPEQPGSRADMSRRAVDIPMPRPPDNLALLRTWIEEDWQPFLTLRGKGDAATLPDPRPTANTAAAEDKAAYKLLAVHDPTAAANTNPGKLHKRYTTDQDAGGLTRTAFVESKHPLGYIFRGKAVPGANSRYSAFKAALLRAVPVTSKVSQAAVRAKLILTHGHEDRFIKIDHSLPIGEQLARYRGEVVIAMQDHDEAIEKATPAGSLDSLKVGNDALVTQLSTLLPKRHTDTEVKRSKIDTFIGQETGFEDLLQELIRVDLEAAALNPEPQAAPVFQIQEKYGGGKPPPASAQGNNNCHFFADPTKGCNRERKCRFDHVGQGFVVRKGTITKVNANTLGSKSRGKGVPNREQGGGKPERRGVKGAFDHAKLDARKTYRVKKGRKGEVYLMAEATDDDEPEDDKKRPDRFENEQQPRKKAKKKHGGKPIAKWTMISVVTTMICNIAALFGAASGHQTNFNGTGLPPARAASVCVAKSMPKRLRHPDPKMLVAIDDSGAGTIGGVCGDERLFHHLDQSTPGPITQVKGLGGKHRSVEGIGSIKIEVQTSVGPRAMIFRNVSYVPGVQTIIAHNQLRTEGMVYTADAQGARWTTPDGVIIPLVEHNGLHHWRGKIITANGTAAHVLNDVNDSYLVALLSASDQDEQVLLRTLDDPAVQTNVPRRNVIRKKLAKLGTYTVNCPQRGPLLQEHCRLGHPSIRTTVKYLQSFLSPSEIKKRYGSIAQLFCASCCAEKGRRATNPSPRLPTKPPRPKATRPGQLTHTDVAGRFDRAPVGSAVRYEVVFIDDCTGHAKLYGIESLEQVTQAIDQYYNYLDSCGHKTDASSLVLEADGAINVATGRRIRGDSASYYKSARAVEVYNSHGVTLEASSPNNQYYNGTAENFWRSMHSRSAACRDAAGLGYEYWIWSDLFATETHNMLPTRRNADGHSPNVLFHRRRIDAVEIFGRPVWVTNIDRRKCDPATRKGVYIGWNSTNQAHRVYFPTTPDARASYCDTTHVQWEPGKPILERVASGEAPLEATDYVEFGPDIEAFELDSDTIVLGSDYQHTQLNDGVIQLQPEPEIVASEPEPYEIDDGDTIVVSTVMPGQQSAQVLAAHSFGGSNKVFEGPHANHFRVADDAEWQQLLRRGILVPVRDSTVPPSEKRYDSLITRVLKDDGVTQTAKSRIVLNGSQQVGDEYTLSKTRTVTPRYSTIRTILALAAGTLAGGGAVYQFDVPNAFGQAPADRTRYMRAPRGQREYIEGDEIIFAVQNLYGGRTAGRNYQNHMCAWLLSIGFRQCPSDPATFYRPAGTTATPDEVPPHSDARPSSVKRRRRTKAKVEPVMDIGEIRVTIWIDDLLYTCEPPAHDWLADKLVTMWDPKREKDPPQKAKYVLGMAIKQSSTSIEITNTVLSDKLVEQFNMQDCKAKATPLSPAVTIQVEPDQPTLNKKDHRQYRSGVAMLTYLATTTRPDLAHAASQLGRVQHQPTASHMEQLRHAIAYVRATRTRGIRYGTPSPEHCNKLLCYADSSWADCKTTRRSSHGYVAILNGGPVSWHARRTRFVALSTAEAEIDAATEATKDIVHVRAVMQELRQAQDDPTTLGQDNQATIAMAEDINSTVTTRTKHIAARYLWLRERIQAGDVALQYCKTEDMIADIMTKPLAKRQFNKFASLITADTNEFVDYTIDETKYNLNYAQEQ